MGLFKTKARERTNYSTPQEMYLDNRRKTIKGPLDYQSKMIDSYMEKAFDKKDVAIELPTGSGKTLIGLLIGEFRRKTRKEKILYVCPTNQLVNQVVEKAQSEYGIKVHGFTKKVADYDPVAKVAYERAEIIAVTNYSSLFINGTFFRDADVIIFDDAHSSESYISSNWTVEISRKKNKSLYLSIAESLKESIEESQYKHLTNPEKLLDDVSWFDKVPNISFLEKSSVISELIDTHICDSDLIYPWKNIKDHLWACNMFLSWDSILIRPYIPPTKTHEPFNNAAQRIYMSATLGESGELERITGVPQIYRLPMVDEWKNKSFGRRFFIFPSISFTQEKSKELCININSLFDRSLFLVQDDESVNKYKNIIEEETQTEVFTIKDIEIDKERFIKSEDGIAILANRYDGIDMDGDKCRMLFISQLPNGTNLQEKFMTNRMAASVLFNERIKTKIIQAIGRCTRSDIDYATVCILGDELQNALLAKGRVETYHPELQAELEFGYTQSEDLTSYESILDQVRAFNERSTEWDDAENEILNIRESFNEGGNININAENFAALNECVKYEVEYQYHIWKENYEDALKCIDEIIVKLNGKSLMGYRGFWNYVGGFVAYKLYLSGNEAYYNNSKEYYNRASKTTKTINWFNKVLPKKLNLEESSSDFGLYEVIDRLELQINQDGVKNSNKFEKKAKNILMQLNSDNGSTFEKGHKELGILLGYEADNSSEDAAPDPWWVINGDHCVVSEDKIYTKTEPKIPVQHVRQANTHELWIKENVNSIYKYATIDTVMITNSKLLETSATIYAKNIWYVQREEFVNWAIKAIEAVRKLRRTFIEPGDMLWRIEAETILIENNATPKCFLEFVRRTKLSELPQK